MGKYQAFQLFAFASIVSLVITGGIIGWYFFNQNASPTLFIVSSIITFGLISIYCFLYATLGDSD